MGFVRVTLFIAAIVLVAVGFAAWRFEFITPYLSNWYYVGIGVALGAAVLLGKVAAAFVWLGSAAVLGYAAIRFLLFKGTVWQDVRTVTLLGVAGLVVGGVLWILGSTEMAGIWAAAQADKQRRVYCSLCGQFLGTAEHFDIPCPRCDGNVPEIRD